MFRNRVRARARALSIFSDSAISINFVQISGIYPSLDSRITFTRSSTGTYFNSSGVLSSAVVDEPRFDYDPATLEAKGLLIEEQRTNSVRNSTAVGGSSGVLPTNWTSNYPLDGLTSTISAPAIEDGITYIDIRVQGTTTLARATLNLVAFEATTAIAALSGQTWTCSAFVKLQAGSLSGFNSVGYQLSEHSATGTFLADTRTTFVPSSASLASQRPSVTRLLNNASTAFILPSISLSYPLGAVIDATFRVGLPQAEQGTFDSSPIQTSTIALTRAADVASITGANFSSWYNASEGTIYTESSTMATSAAGVLTYSISDGTFNQSIYGNFSSGNTYRGANVIDGGIGQASSIATFTGITAANNTKDAFAYKANDFAESCNGVATRTDNSGTVPSVNRLYIGSSWSGSSNFLNGHIRSFSYYPTRLSNEKLQALTS